MAGKSYTIPSSFDNGMFKMSQTLTTNSLGEVKIPATWENGSYKHGQTFRPDSFGNINIPGSFEKDGTYKPSRTIPPDLF